MHQLLKDVLFLQNVHCIIITVLAFGPVGCHHWKIELNFCKIDSMLMSLH